MQYLYFSVLFGLSGFLGDLFFINLTFFLLALLFL